MKVTSYFQRCSIGNIISVYLEIVLCAAQLSMSRRMLCFTNVILFSILSNDRNLLHVIESLRLLWVTGTVVNTGSRLCACHQVQILWYACCNLNISGMNSQTVNMGKQHVGSCDDWVIKWSFFATPNMDYNYWVWFVCLWEWSCSHKLQARILLNWLDSKG